MKLVDIISIIIITLFFLNNLVRVILDNAIIKDEIDLYSLKFMRVINYINLGCLLFMLLLLSRVFY